MNGRQGRTIRVDTLTRVEGEGALLIKMRGNEVTDVKLRIYEPPRFFEALLRGRHCSEAPDITARICGICPVAYQMSAVHAIERALGITIDPAVRQLRRLFYCGEWIESHTLHVFMLHAPDFLGYPDVIAMAIADRLKILVRVFTTGFLLLRSIKRVRWLEPKTPIRDMTASRAVAVLRLLLKLLKSSKDRVPEVLRARISHTKCSSSEVWWVPSIAIQQ